MPETSATRTSVEIGIEGVKQNVRMFLCYMWVLGPPVFRFKKRHFPFQHVPTSVSFPFPVIKLFYYIECEKMSIYMHDLTESDKQYKPRQIIQARCYATKIHVTSPGMEPSFAK